MFTCLSRLFVHSRAHEIALTLSCLTRLLFTPCHRDTIASVKTAGNCSRAFTFDETFAYSKHVHTACVMCRTRVRTCTCTHSCTLAIACAHAHMRACTYARTHAHIHICARAHMRVTCTPVCICAHAHALCRYTTALVPACTCPRALVHICMHAYRHIYHGLHMRWTLTSCAIYHGRARRRVPCAKRYGPRRRHGR
jgi:hypothetical protein